MRKNKWFVGVTLMALVGLVFLTPGVLSALAAAPDNDDFNNAAEITSLPYTDSINTTEATMAGDDPGSNCYGQTSSVWYAFRPETDMWIQTDTNGSSYSTSLGVFTGVRGSLSQVTSHCGSGAILFQATAYVTYYFMINAWSGGPYPSPDPGGNLVFNVSEITGPSNDNFANATVVSPLPFSEQVDTNWATTEANEPVPSCRGSVSKSIWYAFTPGTTGSYTANVDSGNPGYKTLAVYAGSAMNALTEIGCRSEYYWGGSARVTVWMEAGTTYYFQTFIQDPWWGVWWLYFSLDVTPPPNASFDYWPGDPNVYEDIQFYNYSNDPVGAGFQSSAWDFGDGATSTDWSPNHRYAADGNYTVQLTVTTTDGRTGTTSTPVQVRTHDVTITRFIVPQSAKAGQTRQLTVEINNKRYAENVEVELYKSTQSGYVWVGSLRQFVPVRPSNRTTIFAFSYTFTNDDAVLGKVTFRAVANLIDARDALPADNETIALPTRVNR